MPSLQKKVNWDTLYNRVSKNYLIRLKFQKKSNKDTYYNYGLDLEFKIYGPERQIYIKQVRPFKNWYLSLHYKLQYLVFNLKEINIIR